MAHSPWGKIKYSEKFASGIYFVSTSSHGGIRLSGKRQKQIPFVSPFLLSKEFWEEDCDAAIPIFFFRKDIIKYHREKGLEFNYKMFRSVIQCLKNWNPEKFKIMKKYY